MDLFAESTPAIDAIIAAARKLPLNEGGVPVRIRTVSPAEAQIFIGMEEQALGIFLRRYPEGGVLHIGADAGLDIHGAVRVALRERQLDARHIALFGVHRWSIEERDFVNAMRIQVYSMVEISREGLTEMTDAVMAFVRSWPAVHLVVDMTALDAVVPGGFSVRELLYVVQRIRLIRSCVSVEILFADGQAATGAKLLAELERA